MNIERDSLGQLPAFAWPGGYPLFYICADGGTLCPKCANRENGSEASTDKEAPKDWRMVAVEVNWEDADLYCDHCNERVPSAYAESE